MHSIHSDLLNASKKLILSQEKKILLVEDTAAHATLIRRSIDTEIWDFRHVTRGLEAIEIVQDETPYIILLDLSLPDYDGLSLISDLNQINNFNPIIIVTSLEDVKKSVKAMKMGAYDYVVKSEPTEFQPQLKQAIEKAWEKRLDQAEKQLASECKVSEIIKAEKVHAIEELIRTICSEINNPLSSLKTYSSILKSELENNDNIEVIKNLIDCTEEVAKAVNKLKGSVSKE